MFKSWSSVIVGRENWAAVRIGIDGNWMKKEVSVSVTLIRLARLLPLAAVNQNKPSTYVVAPLC